MKKSSNETTTQRLSELIAEGESAKLELKSTLRFNLHSEKNDEALTYACAKTIAAFLNSEGGRLPHPSPHLREPEDFGEDSVLA